MPRQLRIRTLKKDLKKGTSPAMTADKRIHSADCKDTAGVKGTKVGAIKRTLSKMSDAGMAPEPDLSITAEDSAMMLLGNIGIGVVDGNSAHYITVPGESGFGATKIFNTAFTLSEKDTDETIIPNDKILDIKTYNRDLTGPDLVESEKHFPSPDKNPFFTPEEQPSKFEQAKKDKNPGGMPKANTIGLAASIIEVQGKVRTGSMLPEFTRAQGKEK